MDQQQRERLAEIVSHSRRVNTVLVVTAFLGYGAAVYAWMETYQLTALVIAIMAYVLFRSLRKLSYNLTWQAFAKRDGYADMMRYLDIDLLMLQGDRVEEEVARAMEREKTDQ